MALTETRPETDSDVGSDDVVGATHPEPDRSRLLGTGRPPGDRPQLHRALPRSPCSCPPQDSALAGIDGALRRRPPRRARLAAGAARSSAWSSWAPCRCCSASPSRSCPARSAPRPSPSPVPLRSPCGAGSSAPSSSSSASCSTAVSVATDTTPPAWATSSMGRDPRRLALGSIAVATTVLSHRPLGMGLSSVPLFSWSMLVAAPVWIADPRLGRRPRARSARSRQRERRRASPRTSTPGSPGCSAVPADLHARHPGARHRR